MMESPGTFESQSLPVNLPVDGGLSPLTFSKSLNHTTGSLKLYYCHK